MEGGCREEEERRSEERRRSKERADLMTSSLVRCDEGVGGMGKRRTVYS